MTCDTFATRLASYDDDYLSFLYLGIISGFLPINPETECVIYFEMFNR